MQNIFIFFTLFFTVLAPVLVVVIIKEFYTFFTKDLDSFSDWQVDDDELDPIGSHVKVLKHVDGKYEYSSRYISFGSFNEYEDPYYDSHGFPDEYVYFYLEFCCKNHVVGTELCDGEAVVEVVEWNY